MQALSQRTQYLLAQTDPHQSNYALNQIITYSNPDPKIFRCSIAGKYIPLSLSLFLSLSLTLCVCIIYILTPSSSHIQRTSYRMTC